MNDNYSVGMLWLHSTYFILLRFFCCDRLKFLFFNFVIVSVSNWFYRIKYIWWFGNLYGDVLDVISYVSDSLYNFIIPRMKICTQFIIIIRNIFLFNRISSKVMKAFVQYVVNSIKTGKIKAEHRTMATNIPQYIH